jgi:hypothetical protein
MAVSTAYLSDLENNIDPTTRMLKVFTFHHVRDRLGDQQQKDSALSAW